jgi:RNA polymerase sigma factor (sigma-70 family)
MVDRDVEVDEVASLVSGAAGGDARSWSLLVDRFAPLVFAVCRGFRLSPADAADVTQTVWLRLTEHIGRLSQPERVGAWLVTTARRECIAHQRARARYAPDEVDFDSREPSPAFDPPEASALRLESVDAVAEAFALLDDRCRGLLARVVAERTASYQELSEQLGMPVGAIGPTRARCLERLRRNLEASGHGR